MAPSLSIALSITAMAAPFAEASYYSAAAAFAGLASLPWQRGTAGRRQRRARADKLVYAALTAKRFRAGRSEDLLR
jgi:hypothetical protein